MHKKKIKQDIQSFTNSYFIAVYFRAALYNTPINTILNESVRQNLKPINTGITIASH